MLEIASLKIDNESHYLLIIPTIVANVKKIEVNLWIITRIGLIIPIIFVNVKKICKKYQKFSVKVKNQPHWRFNYCFFYASGSDSLRIAA